MCNTLYQNAVLPNLSSTSLIIFDVHLTQPDPVLMNAYITCASNLRSLSLCSFSPNLDIIFPMNPSDFTSLEEVTPAVSLVDCSARTEAVSSFFRAIASKLTSLNISTVDTSDEPLRLFQSFSLSHSEPPASRSPILMQFLVQHAETHKNLHWQHVKPSPIADYTAHLPSMTLEYFFGGTTRKPDDYCPDPEPGISWRRSSHNSRG